MHIVRSDCTPLSIYYYLLSPLLSSSLSSLLLSSLHGGTTSLPSLPPSLRAEAAAAGREHAAGRRRGCRCRYICRYSRLGGGTAGMELGSVVLPAGWLVGWLAGVCV